MPISKSTKADDLLWITIFDKEEKGNMILMNSKTPICKVIEYRGNFPHIVYVLEGINANPEFWKF